MSDSKSKGKGGEKRMKAGKKLSKKEMELFKKFIMAQLRPEGGVYVPGPILPQVDMSPRGKLVYAMRVAEPHKSNLEIGKLIGLTEDEVLEGWLEVVKWWETNEDYAKVIFEATP